MVPDANERWQPRASRLLAPESSLDGQLRLQNLAISTSISDDARALIETRIGEARRAGLVDLSVKVGDRAPRWNLPDASLTDLLQRGPVVMSLYVGEWFPYCALTNRAMQESLPEFEKFDAQLVLTSNIRVARKLGVVMPFQNDVGRIYRDLGFGVPFTETTFVPLPAAFVIDRRRLIRYAFVNPDYRRRAEPSQIADVLAQL
jgi:peroxiredoxin